MLTSSLLALNDVKGVLDRALESKFGVKIQCADPKSAIALRARLNTYRYRDRKENHKTYPVGHRLHQMSEYDILVMSIENETDIYIRKTTETDITVIELPGPQEGA